MTVVPAGGRARPPAAGEDLGHAASVRGRLAGWRAAWPLLPATAVLVLLFLVPLAIMVVYSFWTSRDLNVVAEWTLDNYARFFSNETYLRTFGKTVLMALLVTATTIALALPFGYFLVRYVGRTWQRVVLVLVIVPFWTSYLLRVYAWQAILGERGALNQVLMATGLTSEPSRLFVYNNVGVFIVLVYLYFPFAALAIYASLDKFDFDLFKAAQDLGARQDQAIRHVMLPAIRPGLITACIFVFVPVLGEYLTPALVGGTEGVLISNLIINFFRGVQYPAGSAIAFIVAAFVVLLLVVFRRYLRVEDVVTRG